MDIFVHKSVYLCVCLCVRVRVSSNLSIASLNGLDENSLLGVNL